MWNNSNLSIPKYNSAATPTLITQTQDTPQNHGALHLNKTQPLEDIHGYKWYLISQSHKLPQENINVIRFDIHGMRRRTQNIWISDQGIFL